MKKDSVMDWANDVERLKPNLQVCGYQRFATKRKAMKEAKAIIEKIQRKIRRFKIKHHNITKEQFKKLAKAFSCTLMIILMKLPKFLEKALR